MKKPELLAPAGSFETLQAIADSTAARIAAEANVIHGAIDADKRIKEIRSDAFEIALDAEVDYTETKRALLLKQAENEALPFNVREQAIKDAEALTEESFNRQTEMFNNSYDAQIDKNELAKLSNAGKQD